MEQIVNVGKILNFSSGMSYTTMVMVQNVKFHTTEAYDTNRHIILSTRRVSLSTDEMECDCTRGRSPGHGRSTGIQRYLLNEAIVRRTNVNCCEFGTPLQYPHRRRSDCMDSE